MPGSSAWNPWKSAWARPAPQPRPSYLRPRSREDETPAAPAPPRQPPSLSPENLGETWQAFLAFVQQEEGGPLYAKLSRAHLTEVRDQTLVVGGDRLLNCNGPRQKARLQELVEKFFGPPYRFQIETSAQPAPKWARACAQTPGPARPQTAGLEIFGGRWLTPDNKEDSE
jgi:hypothetical protein